MIRLPQLTLFVTKEQQLYSELPQDDRAPINFFLKAQPNHHMDKVYFSHFYLAIPLQSISSM